jgi:hypothetical protein
MATLKNLWASMIEMFRRIFSIAPIQYFKNLTNKEDPHSSHRFVNLLWGCGSFGMFWASYCYQLFRDVNYRLSLTDYLFIATMAGMSTLSAIAAKQSGDPSNYIPPTPVLPSSITTTTTLSSSPPQKIGVPNRPSSEIHPNDETP